MGVLKITKEDLTAGSTGTIPEAITFTGTFDSVGVILSGDDDLSEKTNKGDYLYSTTLNELRKIIGFNGVVGSAVLEEAFSAPVVGDAIKICRPLYKSVAVENTGGASGNVFGGTILTGKTENYNSDWGIAPTTYDTLTTTFTITKGI